MAVFIKSFIVNFPSAPDNHDRASCTRQDLARSNAIMEDDAIPAAPSTAAETQIDSTEKSTEIDRDNFVTNTSSNAAGSIIEETPGTPHNMEVFGLNKRKADDDIDNDNNEYEPAKKIARETSTTVLGNTDDVEAEEAGSLEALEVTAPPGTPDDAVDSATYPQSSTKLQSCEVEGCEKLRAQDGHCLRHFRDKSAPLRTGTSDYGKRFCNIEGCLKLRSKGKFCHRHNKNPDAPIRNKSEGPVDRKKQCTIENCDRQQVKQGYCSRHFKNKDAPVLETPAFSFDADARWDELFPQLKAFHEKNGHARVPTSQKTDLARFVTHIRCVYRTKNKKVKADPDAAAAAAGATSTTATPETAAVEIASGDPNSLDSDSVIAAHPDLSRSKLLTPERMADLKSVGFEFQLWTVDPSQWEQRFNELLAYKKENGHFHVTVKQNSTLSSWCKTQRQRYKNTMAIFQGIYGVELSNPQKKAKELYETAKEKSKEYRSNDNTKDIPPPTLSDIGEAKNIMNPERICKLNAVGFEWDLQKDTYVESWENRYNQLLKFKVINGNCRVPKSSGDNPQLGQWVKQMRKYHGWKEEGKPYPTTFTDERISRLNELGFEWRLKDTPMKGKKLDVVQHDTAPRSPRLPNTSADVTLQQLNGMPTNDSDNQSNVNVNDNDAKQGWNSSWYGGFEGEASV